MEKVPSDVASKSSLLINVLSPEFSLRARNLQELSNQVTEEPLKPKLARGNFNSGNLSITVEKTSKTSFRTRSSDPFQQSSSASLVSTHKKKCSNEEWLVDYEIYYERAETFLDEQLVKIIEPGAETKIKKHVKVLVSSQSPFEESKTSTPLYSGSPALQKISGSSLLTRRANSNTGSALLKNSGEVENISNDVTNLRIPAVDQGVSRFADGSRKILLKAMAKISSSGSIEENSNKAKLISIV